MQTLYGLYRDNHSVSTATKDVEQLKANADTFGLLASIAAFGLNEVARLTLRSRRYPSLC